jgi:hypothetical protein
MNKICEFVKMINNSKDHPYKAEFRYILVGYVIYVNLTMEAVFRYSDYVRYAWRDLSCVIQHSSTVFQVMGIAGVF